MDSILAPPPPNAHTHTHTHTHTFQYVYETSQVPKQLRTHLQNTLRNIQPFNGSRLFFFISGKLDFFRARVMPVISTSGIRARPLMETNVTRELVASECAERKCGTNVERRN